MVFNHRMEHPDAQRIQQLGGSTAVAKLLGYDLRDGGAQRVNNWRKRGIPSKVKVARPDLFMVDLNGRATERAS